MKLKSFSVRAACCLILALAAVFVLMNSGLRPPQQPIEERGVAADPALEKRPPTSSVTSQQPLQAAGAIPGEASTDALASTSPPAEPGNPSAQASATIPRSQTAAASGVSGVPQDVGTAFPEDIGIDLSSDEARARTVARLKAAEDANLALALKTAREKGSPTSIPLEDGRQAELSGIRKNGELLYRANHNTAAAVSANVIPLRTRSYLPQGLFGEGWKVGVWEAGGGTPLFSHPEFDIRVNKGDQSPTVLNTHATHVIGTILASGVKPEARGMAPRASVDSYDADNDTSEMAAVAATDGQLRPTRIFLSNHSYGVTIGWDSAKANVVGTLIQRGDPIWFGNDSAGLYDADARAWDALVQQAPYFLPFRSAGNERGGKLKSGSTFYWVSAAGNYRKVTDVAHPPENGGRPGGYETIANTPNAKNIMTIGNAEDAVRYAWDQSAYGFFQGLFAPPSGVNNFESLFRNGGVLRDPALAKPYGSSSWGPTDDGRIKPDLMANGSRLYSSSHDTNKVATGTPIYDSKSGTSMSSPSAAGAALLLQEYHHEAFGSAMRAARLKALLLHTADELDATGPDYRTGWGLINAQAAANVLKSAVDQPGHRHLYDGFLSDVDPLNPSSFVAIESQSFSFEWNGTDPLIKATVVWSDPPGTAKDVEERTPSLVNDLDIRLITPSGHTQYPWVLDPENPGNPAAHGDNIVDNVEQVIESVPEPGTYTLVVSRKGTLRRYNPLSDTTGGEALLTGGQQPFSLILTGNGTVQPFHEGLDDVRQLWNANGDVPWSSSAGVATCRLTSSPQSSYFETAFDSDAPRRVTGWWSIGLDPNVAVPLRSPILIATENGREMARLDRMTGWRPFVLDLPPGRRVLRWTFVAERDAQVAGVFAQVREILIRPMEKQFPYNGLGPITSRIEAEDYDAGDPGDAYLDSDLKNRYSRYRDNGVDIMLASDTDRGFAVTDTSDGEWLEYTATVPVGGLYTMELRVAAEQAGSILRVGGLDIPIPSTGGSARWQTISRPGFQFFPVITRDGTRFTTNTSVTVRLEWVKGGADLNWFRWIPEPWPDRKPFATTINPAGLPWDIATQRIQAEDFDTGGESIAYHDSDGVNTGGQYRLQTAVDIKATDDPGDVGGLHVTQFGLDEYLRYSVKVPSTDDYEVRVRLRPVSLQGFTFASGQVQVSLGGGGVVPLGFNASTAQWLTVTGRVSLVAQNVNSDLTLKCTLGAAEVNWIEFSRVPAAGLTKLMFLERPGTLLDNFYPQPRGQGQYPRGQERFSHPRIPSSLESELLRDAFEVHQDVGQNYGVVVAGYVLPPVTSDYTFYLCSDDQGELWLSTDESPLNSRLIATEPEWNTSRAWTSTLRRPLVDGRPPNVSGPIRLEAGRRYYVEATMKQGTGQDNLAVAWRRPGQAAIQDLNSPIESQFLRPLDTLPLYEVQTTWATPAAIRYGTPLGSNQLNVVTGKFGEAGSIRYDPPAGSVLPVGTHTLQGVWVPKPEFELEFTSITNTTTLVVTPAPLVITANSAQREARQANPTFTATYSGLVNGDTAGHLERGVQFRCAAAPSSAPGTYRITAEGAYGSNYTITYLPGFLTVTPATQRPFAEASEPNPSATPVPGRIEAEAYDQGGQGRAYHDLDPANNGGQLRPADGVDLGLAADAGAGHFVGWTATGEWQEYSINVAKSGDYNLTLRIAQAGAGSIVQVWVGGQLVTSPIALPPTGGEQVWVDVTKWRIPLTAGTQVMRIEWIAGGANLNWIEWQPASDNAPRPLVWWHFNADYDDAILNRKLVGGTFLQPGLLPVLVSESPLGTPDDHSASFTGNTFAHLPEVAETQPLDLEGRDYTVEAWIQFARPASGKSILVTWSRPGAGGWSTWIDSDGNLGSTSYGIVDRPSTAKVPDDGRWHHVAIAHQRGQRLDFFIDGQLKETLLETGGLAPAADYTLHLGYELVDDAPLNPFVGQIDRLRISKGALKASQLDYPAAASGENHRGLNRVVYRYTPGSKLDDFYPAPRGHQFLPPGWEPAGPNPTQTGRVDQFEAPVDLEDDYGQVLFGYIVPPQTGDYTFFLCSDDQGELWLSTNESPVNSRRIAWESEGSGSRNWTGIERRPLSEGRPSNVSPSIRLEAGKYYYVEAAMKKGTGADNLGVAWQQPGTSVPAHGSAPIGGEHLRAVLLQTPSTPGTGTQDLIVNGSFEEPRLSNVNENNIGTVPTGWSLTGPEGSWNMVQNDGTPYGSGVDVAKDGSQILDIAGRFELFQSFTLSEASTVSFGASFANREAHDGSPPSTVGIYSAAGNVLLSSLVSVDTSPDPVPSTEWRSGAASVDLPAGQYQIRIDLNDFNNVDAVFARAARNVPSNNADLASLLTSAGTLAPAFDSGTMAYAVSVSNATSSITLTATAAQADATIRILGTTVASGADSGPIALLVGSNPVTVAVTAQDGTTVKSYVVTVTRAASAIVRNLIVNGSFEEPRLGNVNENNIGSVPTGWSQVGPDDTWNMIQNDGTPYGSGVSVAKDGSQILDIAGRFELFQSFTLSEASTVSFGASFANREAHDGSPPSTVGIYNATGSVLLSSLVSVNTSTDPVPSTEWRSGVASVDLPAGQYQIRIDLNDFNNVDAAFARAAIGVVPPTNGESITTISVFTGGDAGEGLDLDGHFIHAFNVGSPGAAGQARDAQFTEDNAPGIALTAGNEIADWSAPMYGTSANDDVIGKAMQSIRWSDAAAAQPSVDLSLAGLVTGKAYKLQLLFTESCCVNRAFDVIIGGKLIAHEFNPGGVQGNASGTPTNGVVITHEFTATNTTLTFSLDGRGTVSPQFGDHNAILGGVTLEELDRAADPRLTITQAGASLVISWDAAAEFVLERTDRLTPGSTWTSVPFTTQGSTSSVSVNPAGTTPSFFRLRHP